MDLQAEVNVDGFGVRYKVYLVAKGFTQVENIGFNETFSPIAWMESIWDVLTFAPIEDLKVHQMDVKIIFLNGKFQKKYLQQLEGFVVKGKVNMVHVYKL